MVQLASSTKGGSDRDYLLACPDKKQKRKRDG